MSKVASRTVGDAVQIKHKNTMGGAPWILQCYAFEHPHILWHPFYELDMATSRQPGKRCGTVIVAAHDDALRRPARIG